VLIVLALLALVAAGTVGARLMTPAPPVWTPTELPLTARHQMSLVTLADGRVLMAGGETPDAAGTPVLGAEFWDPRTGGWSAVGDLALDRRDSVAVLLTDGRVLILDADTNADGPAAGGTAEVFDPATGRFSPAGRLQARHDRGIGGAGWQALWDAVMVPLPGGHALVVGGRPGQNADGTGDVPAVAELWDPDDSAFHATEPLPCDPSRGAAAPLADGTVLIVCSVPYTGIGRLDARLRDPLWEPDAVILDPVAGTFVRIGKPTTMSTGAATRLPGGRVLLTGAAIADSTDPAEIREPDGTFKRLDSPVNPVASSVVVTLSDDRVLFVDRRSTTALLFDPETEAFSTLKLPAPLAYGAVAPLTDGRALVVFGPDWESPGPRQYPPGPMVLDPGH
jgi:hypothetical protein